MDSLTTWMFSGVQYLPRLPGDFRLSAEPVAIKFFDQEQGRACSVRKDF